MRAKTLIVLALVAAAAIVGSALLERGSAPDPAVSDGTLLYPGLTEAINGITRVRFSDPGTGEPVQLERTDAGWIVVQKDGYPADAGKIRQLLLRLAEARLAETKTANPELYPRLGVADPGAAEGAGTLLVIDTPSEIRLIVGRQDSRAGGTYVRREGQEQSYLVDTDITLAANPVDWVEREIFDINNANIRELRVTHADGEVLQLMRVGGQMVAAGIPEGRELSSPGAARPMTSLLSPLRVEDVVPREGFEDEPEATIDFHLEDGRRITARAWRRDEERWMAFDLSLDPPSAPPTAVEATGEVTQETDLAGQPPGQPAGEAAASAEGTATEEAAAPERADPETVAREDAALAGWVFKVPTYKYDQVVRRMEDLLKPTGD